MAMLEVKDLQVYYGVIQALKGISFHVNQGEVIALIGANGAGKTTLIKLLCRLYEPTSGYITLNGIDIRKYSYKEYTQAFSVVFQDFHLFSLPLDENITYDKNGYPEENSLFQYKIPARTDVGKIKVEFESSYEPNGPFGAKSIGEVVINTPLPAISDAIYNAIGTRFYELPITPEKIAMAVAEKQK